MSHETPESSNDNDDFYMNLNHNLTTFFFTFVSYSFCLLLTK